MPANRNGARPAAVPASQPAILAEQEVAGPGVADRRFDRMEQQQPIHAPVVPGGGQIGERRRGSIAPENIAVDDVERSPTQQRQGIRNAAAGLQQRRFDAQADRRRATPRQVALDERREMMRVDDHLLDALRLEAVDGPVEHRSPADLDQRLRQTLGNRSHAQAEAGRQHHRLSRPSVRRCGADAQSRTPRLPPGWGSTRAPTSAGADRTNAPPEPAMPMPVLAPAAARRAGCGRDSPTCHPAGKGA